MSVTEAKIAVLRAVAEGATSPAEVMTATGLPAHEVMGAAAALRGDGERGELLLCLDGEPWALTEAGARLLQVLAPVRRRR